MNQINKFTVTLVISIALLIPITCNGQNNVDEKQNLKNFAYKTCMSWYFKSKKQDAKEVYVLSSSEFFTEDKKAKKKYQKISSFIKNYKTKRKPKKNVDPNLLKCFYLDKNTELTKLIKSLK